MFDLSYNFFADRLGLSEDISEVLASELNTYVANGDDVHKERFEGALELVSAMRLINGPTAYELGDLLFNIEEKHGDKEAMQAVLSTFLCNALN